MLLDFSKAFDKVLHRKLLRKVDFYGIRGKTKAWIAAFLAHHTQRVLVNGKASSTSDVLSGVPHGTVLCPLLFLLYINDISTAINSALRLFADDSLVHREIKSPADHFTLQDDINRLHEWAERWQMNCNVTKCAVMSLSTRKVLQHDYIMNAQLIPRVQKHDYLGITISSSLTWKDQCTKVGNKAKRTLRLVKRTLHVADRSIRKTAYEMLVRPPWNMQHVPGRHTPRRTNSV